MHTLLYRLGAVLMLSVALAACVSTPQTAQLAANLPQDSEARVVLSGVPFFAQQEYQCGPAALATVLINTGATVSLAQLIDEVYVPERHGSFQVEMLAAARSHGRLAYVIEPSLADMLVEVQAGNPVLVLQNLGLRMSPQWHFAVVKGYDLATQKIILNSGEIENYALSLKTFERTWSRAEHWGVVVAAPGVIPATASSAHYFQSLSDLQHSYTGFEQIKMAYQKALLQWPENRELLMGLGNHLLAHNQFQEAADLYFQVVSLYANYPPGLNNLAHTLLVLGEPAQALSYAAQAVKLAGQYEAVYQQTYRDISERLQ